MRNTLASLMFAFALLPTAVGCGSDSAPLGFSWALEDSTSGQPVSCQQAGVTDVGITGNSGGAPFTATAACTANRGQTLPLKLGVNYTIQAQVYGNTTRELLFTGEPIIWLHDGAPLPQITIPINTSAMFSAQKFSTLRLSTK